MNVIEFENEVYPELQTKGNTARYALPFAQQMLSGDGIDIGCMKLEWAFPGAMPIDLDFDDEWEAMNLPNKKFDYIFSSHCLEHLPDWVGTLDYWGNHLKEGGTMFLYLPHYAQRYWRPWNNRKHMNILTPEFIRDYFKARKYKNIMVTEGYDLNHAFYGVAEKC